MGAGSSLENVIKDCNAKLAKCNKIYAISIYQGSNARTVRDLMNTLFKSMRNNPKQVADSENDLDTFTNTITSAKQPNDNKKDLIIVLIDRSAIAQHYGYINADVYPEGSIIISDFAVASAYEPDMVTKIFGFLLVVLAHVSKKINKNDIIYYAPLSSSQQYTTLTRLFGATVDDPSYRNQFEEHIEELSGTVKLKIDLRNEEVLRKIDIESAQVENCLIP